MTDTTLETRYPWISSCSPSTREITLPTHSEAGKSSEIWTVRIPDGVNIEALQSTKWVRGIDEAYGRWTANVDGTTYFLEEVQMNSPCYAMEQQGPEGSVSMTPVIRQLVVYAGDRDEEPVATSKKKRKS